MNKLLVLLFIVLSYTSFSQDHPIALAIHGGAGTISKKTITPEQQKAYEQKLEEALKAGFKVLENGGKSTDAVIAAITIMEDSPLFNAGKGSVFTNDGKNEMDASIMDGSNLKAGAVAGVRIIKNPILAARAVMDKSKHVLMVSKGAEKFAKENGIELADTSYFFDENRWKQLQKAKQLEKAGKDSSGCIQEYKDFKFGTVGCVALDKSGNLAAGTSTGGMTNKKYGRVGDSPIIGAGTYANNKTCAVSCTGWGEFFIRLNVAHDISCLVDYAHKTIKEAGEEVIMKKIPALGGDGGCIILDQKGNISMPFNTEGMFRGMIDVKGKMEIGIYR